MIQHLQPRGLQFGLPPGIIGGPEWPQAELLAQRVVFVNGIVDGEAAARISAELMTLDAMGTDPVDVYIDSADGTLDAALILIDTLDLMRAETRTYALGTAAGPAVGVLAAGKRRTAGPSVQLRLVEPRGIAAGKAVDLQAQLDQHRRLLERFHDRLAQTTGRAPADIANDLKSGRSLDAHEALEYGLIDSIAARSPRAAQSGEERTSP
jgi:ATP-dependent Clp protease, protease subunit